MPWLYQGQRPGCTLGAMHTQPQRVAQLPCARRSYSAQLRPTAPGSSTSQHNFTSARVVRRHPRPAQRIAVEASFGGGSDGPRVNTTEQSDASTAAQNGSTADQPVNGNGTSSTLPSSSSSKKHETVVAPTLDNASLPVSARKSRMPHRWRVVAMMALSFVLCNMDKVNMSVAVIPMASELGWSATDRGLVSSAFFWGYSATQVPAGWLSTRIGGARILFAGVLLWSLGTLIAPPAAHNSLIALCATRVFVGLGEGLAPSSVTNIMAQLVPERERARAVTTVFGGLDVGSAVGLLLCGPLIRLYGWPIVFYAFAVLGLVWCLFWPLVKPEQPDPKVAAEMASDSGEEPVKPDKGSVPWGAFFKAPAVWAVIVAHFCYNWGYYTLLAWLPSYFELALGLNVDQSSLLTLIPYIAMTAMTPFVGPVADGLVSRGWSVTNVRKFSQGIAFAGPALCMLACAHLTPAAGAAGTPPTALLVGVLSLAFGLCAWARAGLYCNHQDISPRYAAALLGISNTAGALPGVLGVTAAGYLLDATGSWAQALFLPTAACQVFGLVVYSAFASSKKIKFTASSSSNAV